MTRFDGFFVDPGALSATRAGVGRLAGELDGFAGFEDGRPAIFGDDEVAKAVDEFRDEWGEGVRKLAADCDSIARRLAATIDEYRRVDDDVAAAFRDGAGAH